MMWGRCWGGVSEFPHVLLSIAFELWWKHTDINRTSIWSFLASTRVFYFFFARFKIKFLHKIFFCNDEERKKKIFLPLGKKSFTYKSGASITICLWFSISHTKWSNRSIFCLKTSRWIIAAIYEVKKTFYLTGNEVICLWKFHNGFHVVIWV